MPLPKPKPNEDKDTFISRCASDETMNSEFPEKDQRIAVCYKQWENKNENIDDKVDKYLIERETKRTVTVNGEKTKVRFENKWLKRTYDKENEKHNEHLFIINGEEYPVKSISKRNKGQFSKFSTRFVYDGKTFPDSEKKVIEYILNKEKK